MIDIRIADGDGSGKVAHIDTNGAIATVEHAHPPLDNDSRIMLPVREYLKTSAGSSDMLVDGSSTPQKFAIRASAEYDIWVKSISFVIADAGAALNEFGNLSALTNGCQLDWISEQQGDIVLGDELKTNFDMVRLANFNQAFGGGATAFVANNVQSTSEAFLPVLDFPLTFGFRWGIPLVKGTNDCVQFTINDNVSTMDRFDAIAYGVKI